MKIYKCIIIDDEKHARSLMQGMVEELCKDLEVVALCEDLPNGVKAIRKYKPDLVFLDIEMPGHSGLELLDFFDPIDVSFDIIFTTAYHHYAIQAFKLSAVDYLLKPIEPDDLESAIERFRKKSYRPDFSVLKTNLTPSVPRKLAIPTVSSIQFVETDQILFMKADGAYTQITLIGQAVITSSKSLKVYEEILGDNRHFFRCHKSYIVNLSHVSEYVKSDGGYLMVARQFPIALSADKAPEVLQLLTHL